MFTLPVGGATIALKIPDGADDLRLVEATASAIEVAIALLDGLAGGALDARALVVTDFESLLLQLRAFRLGPEMSLGFECQHCRALAEASFRVADCLAAARPRPAPEATPDPARPGWYRLGEAGFRLPTAGDQAAAALAPRPVRRLAELCLDEVALRPPHRARVERVMEAMAPLASRSIAGACPECGAPVSAGFAVAPLVVTEMRRAAGALHDEVDLIARAYHWPEGAILALPQRRRRAYAERIRNAFSRAA
jgi:hypothetical protein